MRDDEKDMQLIAILSGELGDDYTFIECHSEHVEHFCKQRNEQIPYELYEVEFFKEGVVKTEKANFCEHCNEVFIYKAGN
jgi:hypothetical protein